MLAFCLRVDSSALFTFWTFSTYNAPLIRFYGISWRVEISGFFQRKSHFYIYPKNLLTFLIFALSRVSSLKHLLTWPTRTVSDFCIADKKGFIIINVIYRILSTKKWIYLKEKFHILMSARAISIHLCNFLLVDYFLMIACYSFTSSSWRKRTPEWLDIVLVHRMSDWLPPTPSI